MAVACWENISGSRLLGKFQWQSLAGKVSVAVACWESISGSRLLGKYQWQSLAGKADVQTLTPHTAPLKLLTILQEASKT